MFVTAREQPDRRVAANWDRAGRSEAGGGEGIGASGARTTLPTTGYDGASKHQGNAFATHPLYLKNENKSNSRRTSHLMLKLIQFNLSRRFKANQIWSVFLVFVRVKNNTKKMTRVVIFLLFLLASN